MKCLNCELDNLEDAVFCRKCGTRLEILCPECGKSLLPDSSFCQKCGHDLRKTVVVPPVDYSQPQSYTPKYLADKILTTRSSIEGEKKLVTVLFADVANYTSIAEKLDPEEVHQIMDGCFQILMDEVHKYEGTINQFTGDGVMALFGAPVAHEDHAQRACHAALAIQKGIKGFGEEINQQHQAKFQMRIGLNSGPVIVGSIGDDLRMDYTAVGDTTNLANRMQDMADPGSVLISGHTHRLSRDFFEFTSLGQVEVKGKEEPQEAYELLRPSEVETRIEAAAVKGLTRFVGRGKELETLKEALESAKSGFGQVIGVVGEAGVGKSRLLLELRGALPEGGYSYLEGRCLHYGGSMPYLPVLDVLKAYFEVEEGDRESAIKKKLEERFRQLDEKPQIVPPALHEVLSLKVEDEKYAQLGPQQRREETFEAIRDVLIRESQRKPLILAIEDLHWIDKTSEEFLDYLIGFLPTARILLILLYRPEYTHIWGSKSYYGKIGLDQLSAQTSMELVQALLEGGKVAPEIGGLVLGRAGGNPLFVEELTHSLVENGSIQRKDDRFVLAQEPSEIEVPDTIQGIIAARMDRIEENLKQTIQVASVIGREFAYRILQAIIGMSEDLKSSLLNLQGLEFIYEKQLFPELEYIFKHALTQEVAYNSLLVKRRKEIHERIGQAIERLYSERIEEYYELLAYHYVRSDNKEKAVEYLDLANQKTAGAYALEVAKACFDDAMKLLDSLPENHENRQRRISLLAHQDNLFLLLFEMPEYYELLIRYQDQAEELSYLGLRGAFYLRMAYCELIFGAFDKSIQTTIKALELCETAGKAEEAGFAYLILLWCHLYKADFERVFALRQEVLREMDEKFNLVWYVRALTGTSHAYAMLGRWDRALEEADRALAKAQEYSDNSLISFSVHAFLLVYFNKGDLERAIEYAEFAVKKAPTLGDKTWTEGYLAYTQCHTGELDIGIEGLIAFNHLARTGRLVLTQLVSEKYLTKAYIMAGEYGQAKLTVDELMEIARTSNARWFLGHAHCLLGEIELMTITGAAALHFEKAISIFQEIRAENDLALAYSGMGRYYKQQGNVQKARNYLMDALEVFERLGTLIEPDKVREALAELPQ